MHSFPFWDAESEEHFGHDNGISGVAPSSVMSLK